MQQITCPPQNYAWGKVGLASEVARMMAAQGQAVDETLPYAEYWFGTHHKAPAVLAASPETQVSAWLQSQPEAAGARVSAAGGQLPYLFKVLSVAKGLSVQAHPDKALAERLHSERPEVYKDDNHKPEMAIAVTDFEAMCQFRPAAQLAAFAKAVPELTALMGAEAVEALAAQAAADPGGQGDDFKGALRAAFRNWCHSDDAKVAAQVGALVARLKRDGCAVEGDGDLTFANEIAVRLDAQFPGGDVGVFSPYLLNCIKMKAGQAIFLAANEPHAYLSGDIFECMARSDNVVRMGCTPKLKDKDTLCDMLTYQTGLPRVMDGVELLGGGSSAGDGSVRLYQPLDDAVTEFQVERIEVKPGKSVVAPVCDTPCILVCCTSPEGTGEGSVEGGGGGVKLQGGGIVLQNAGTAARISADVSSKENLVLFRACARQPAGAGGAEAKA